MRKNIVVLSSLVLTLLLALATTGPVKADINNWMWLQPAFDGFDDFYSANVIAYAEGTTARLSVVVDVDGSASNEINVTAVSVVFDWGGNYTLVPSPAFTINSTAGQISQAAFTVSFTVPSVSTASNMFLHAYTIYVKYNTTAGARPPFTDSDSNFAVYSTTQTEAQNLKQTAEAYTQPTGGFSSVEARILWEKGDAELDKGDTAYMLGAFDNARTYYGDAITFYGQAYDAETTYSEDYRASQTAINTAQANYYDGLSDYYSRTGNATLTQADASMITANAAATEADAAVRQADAALTNAYGWMTFGVGWVLIGIGAIVYGLRKPKPPS
jgi:hypothetical protein